MTTPLAPLSSEARERVVEVLTRHFASDDLSEAELESRLQLVYAATTRADLDRLIADLPTAASDASPPAVVAPPTVVTAVFSGQERRLSGVVPRAHRVRAHMGYVELDLTQATLQPGVTTIDVRAYFGYVQIRLPKGVRVESTGGALFGYFAAKGEPEASSEPGAEPESVVRITGRAAFGYAEAIRST